MDTIITNVGGVELTFKVEYERDDFMGAPWDEHDGHGVVSEWTSRAKKPGELVLSECRGSKRYYDFAAYCAIARKEDWDAAPCNDGTETKRQQATKAARANYEYLREWCNDEWYFAVVTVTLLDENGDETEVSDTLGGVETRDDYVMTQAREMADELAHGLGTRWDRVEKHTYAFIA